jgi:hypothetical protein
LDKIRELSKLNNNVYLSATIDKIDEYDYYNKDIRDMIEQKYLCDYNIHIPIFTNDVTNKNVCEHLISKYRNIIIYCNSQKEGKKINELMNKLQPKCSEYIDCDTTKTKRNSIINKYKKGDIPFLINVRILVEGFNAPITRGVCFLHLPRSKTAAIQIIGRALRKHPMKTIANVILPFSTNEDGKDIGSFLKVMSENDSRIKKSFNEKKTGGYIEIEKVKNKDEKVNDKNEEEVEFKYNMVYDKLGILVNNEEIWEKRLEELQDYLDLHKKRPSCKDKNKKIKSLGLWTNSQAKTYHKHIYIMKEKKVRKMWEIFTNNNLKYFIDKNTQWMINLNKVKEYITKNKKKPLNYDKNEETKKLASWLSSQSTNYSKKNRMMKNQNTIKIWEKFINDYSEYFDNYESKWINNLNKIKEYINKNKKKPTDNGKDERINTLSRWLSAQQTNYCKNICTLKKEHMRKIWIEFTNEYSIYFYDNDTIWINNLNKVKEYIDKYKKKPSRVDKNKEINKLARWISFQLQNYLKNQFIMTKDNIKKLWTEFLRLYSEYFLDNETTWINNLNKTKEYININKKRPSEVNKDIAVNTLGKWISIQLKNHSKEQNIMKNEKIKNMWEKFIDDYNEYFADRDILWITILKKVKEYININKKRPTNNDNKKLKTWISTQIINYQKKEQIMKEDKIRKDWEDFIDDYSEYFQNNKNIGT